MRDFRIHKMNKSRGAEVERLKTFSHDMKKILFVLTMLALVLPALPRVKGQEVSVDFFYNNLSGGNWIDVEGYGYGWQPDVAVNDPNWRPYADGYWAYTDDGWTWISYEDFGWATYHYGRWAKMADYGWVWFLGSDLDWGPAWVSWRTGGDYVGWAPLPPRGPGIVYEGQPIGGQVDIEFDIGPAYYNFIDARFIGEPVLRDRIYPWSQNVTYINNTVNVTNITVQNNVVYNYGPDYNVLSARSSRPIQRLTIERQPGTNLSVAAKSGALTKVQGGKLMVAAPNKINKPAQGIAPPKVKTKVAQPKLEHGWSGVPNEAQLKQKIKTENPKNIPPPTRAAATGQPPTGISPAVPPASIASPAPTAPVTGPAKGKRPGRPGALEKPAGTPAGIASPAPTAPTTPFERRRGRRPQPGVTEAPAGPPTTTAAPSLQGSPGPTGRGRPERGRFETSPPPGQPGAAPTQPEQGRFRGRGPERTAPPSPTAAPESRGGMERGQRTYEQPGAGASPAGAAQGETRGGRQRGQGAYEQQPGGVPATGAVPGEVQGGRQRGQGAYAQPGGAPGGGSPAGEQPGQGKPQGGKKKGEKVSPSPGPQ